MEDNEQCEGALSDDVMVLQSVRFGPLHLSSALQLFCSVFSPSFLVNLSFSHCQSFHSFPSKQILSPPSFLSASFNLIPALLSLSSPLPLLHRNLHFWRTCFCLQALPVPLSSYSASSAFLPTATFSVLLSQILCLLPSPLPLVFLGYLIFRLFDSPINRLLPIPLCSFVSPHSIALFIIP